MNTTPTSHNEFHAAVRNVINAENVNVQGPSHPTPQELCYKPFYWTDRSELVELLTQRLTGPEPRPIQIHGPFGSGKTALASVVAAATQTHFSDGVLHLEPRKRGADQEMVSALERLGRTQAPTTDRSADNIYRSILFTRRLLVILDDPADRTEIERFWPRSPNTAYVVLSSRASRWREAHYVELSPLEREHAAELLATVEDLAAKHIDRLVDRFGGLPGPLLDAGVLVAADILPFDQLVALVDGQDDEALVLRRFESLSSDAQQLYVALAEFPDQVIERSLLEHMDAGLEGERPSNELISKRLITPIGPGKWRLGTKLGGAARGRDA